MHSEAEIVAQEAAEPGSVDTGSLSYSARARLDSLRMRHDKGYSLRRMIYVFGTVGFLLITNTTFVALGFATPLAEKYVVASFDLIMWITIAYLSAGVMDRSGALRRWGEGYFSRRYNQQGQ